MQAPKIISSITNALIYRAGQPGKESAPLTQIFRLTTAGAGSGLPQDIMGVAEAPDENILVSGQSYEKRNGRERAENSVRMIKK